MPELQRLRADHAAAVEAFEVANRAWFASWISDRGDDYFDRFAERHRAALEAQDQGVEAYYLFIDDDGSVLGRFNLYNIGGGTAEVGYRVAERAAGRGVATAAVRDLCRLAAEHGLERLRAKTAPENVASQKVLTRAGFTAVGPADVAGRPGTWYERHLTTDDRTPAVGPPRETTTERLVLRACSEADVAELFPITSDPDTWLHAPEGRHTEEATTRAWLERAAARWERDGLSYWMARRRSDGVPVGVGGAQRQATGNWNLFYRLDPAAWGHGYATEISLAAIAAAHAIDDSVPVIAWIDEHNERSIAVARRLGMTERGPGTDPSDGETRLAFTHP